MYAVMYVIHISVRIKPDSNQKSLCTITPLIVWTSVKLLINAIEWIHSKWLLFTELHLFLLFYLKIAIGVYNSFILEVNEAIYGRCNNCNGDLLISHTQLYLIECTIAIQKKPYTSVCYGSGIQWEVIRQLLHWF